jgi:hypothetical protein
MPDAYTRKARIAPAVLLAIPPAALLVAGAVSPEVALRAVGVFLGAVGILIAVLVRDAGRRIQPRLWQAWGGPPTVARLRWHGSGSVAAIARLHHRLETVTGEPLPDEQAEAANSDEADRRYDEAVGVLRERTRDAKAFPLVAAENADYGFRRNTLGLRPLGTALSVLGLLVSIAFVFLAPGALSSRAKHWGPAGGVCALCLIFWLAVANDAWVRRAADNYADRLLGAVDSLISSGD